MMQPFVFGAQGVDQCRGRLVETQGPQCIHRSGTYAWYSRMNRINQQIGCSRIAAHAEQGGGRDAHLAARVAQPLEQDGLARRRRERVFFDEKPDDGARSIWRGGRGGWGGAPPPPRRGVLWAEDHTSPPP